MNNKYVIAFQNWFTINIFLAGIYFFVYILAYQVLWHGHQVTYGSNGSLQAVIYSFDDHMTDSQVEHAKQNRVK
jgi:hypothetical protein